MGRFRFAINRVSAGINCESEYAAPTELDICKLLILQICRAYGAGCGIAAGIFNRMFCSLSLTTADL
jgi:hypothetical protein